MLPAKFSSTGLYSDRVHQRTAAFRLLVHAEFESYLEDVVTDHVTHCVRDWVSGGRASITLAAIFAYDDVAGKQSSSLLSPPQNPAGLLQQRIDEAVNRFNRQVRLRNHGVREANILSMVLPIGLNASSIDLVWLGEMDSWGAERGELAHQSSGKVKLHLDPAREYSKVKSLIVGLKQLDEAITRLR